MFKTMWNMPAQLLRLGERTDDVAQIDPETVGEPVATGSLEDMIKTADEFDADEGERLVIRCAGRDRPITWTEIRGLRRSSTFPVEA